MEVSLVLLQSTTFLVAPPSARLIEHFHTVLTTRYAVKRLERRKFFFTWTVTLLYNGKIIMSQLSLVLTNIANAYTAANNIRQNTYNYG